jgi:arsenate reductase (thioredoxin)
MSRNPVTVFVCEHGAAKSIVAAAYFNRFATQMGLDLHAVARGTNPDKALSPQVVRGLSEDGLTPAESVPQKLTEADLQSAQQVIAFCDLPVEYQQPALIERWDHIPPFGENYAQARDAIIRLIRQMLNQ